MFLYIFKIIIKLIITSSQFDPSLTSIQPQKPWTFLFYSSMNGPGLKKSITMLDFFKRKGSTSNSSKVNAELPTTIVAIPILENVDVLILENMNFPISENVDVPISQT